MSVEIDINLSADGIEGRINAITAALEALDEAGDDIDLGDSLDVDGVTGQIGNLKRQLKELDDQMGEMSRKVKNNDFGIPEKVRHEHEVNMPTGATNAGDSTGGDPPTVADGDSAGRGLNKRQIQSRVESLAGFDRGSFSLLDDFDTKELNNIASNLDHSIRDLTSGEYSHVSGVGDGNLGAHQMSSEDIDNLSWNELQSRAAEAGVYQSKAEMRSDLQQEGPLREGWYQEKLRSRLKALDYSGDDGFVDTASHGKVSRQKAHRIASGAHDVSIPGGESSAVKKLRAQQKRLLEESNIDPEAVAAAERIVADDDGNNTERWRQFNQGKRRGDYDIAKISRATRQGRGMPDFDQIDNPIENNSILRRLDKVKSKGDIFDALTDGTDAFGKKLRKLKPTMGKYMQLLAALIPIAVALGTQLIGVAAAMGAVAAAGAGIIGLGLLGHGESMAGSFAQAKQQVQDLKKELFNMAQPLMQQLAPIQSRMFDAIPQGLERVFEQMEGMAAFEDTLFELGSALAGGFERAGQIINENQQEISNLTTSIGGLIGSGLLDFFEWLIQSASENKQLLISLGKDMMTLVAAGYNLSMAIAQILTAFSPWYKLLLVITELMRNDLVITIIQLVGWMYAIVKAATLIHGLYAGFMSLAAGIKTAVAFMTTYTMTTWQAVAATAALVGLLTGGLALLGGVAGLGAVESAKPTGGVNGGSGGQTVYNDNRSFKIEQGGDDYASRKAIGEEVNTQMETNEAQSLPDVSTSSGDGS